MSCVHRINDKEICLSKCNKCQKYYRWICVYCFCNSTFNVSILDKIFCLDLKNLDKYLYEYLFSFNQDLVNFNSPTDRENGSSHFLQNHCYPQNRPSNKNAALSLIFHTGMIVSMERQLVESIVSGSYKIDYVSNNMMNEVVGKFFKRQHYDILYDKVKSIASYQDYLVNKKNMAYFGRIIYQVYMVQINDNLLAIEESPLDIADTAISKLPKYFEQERRSTCKVKKKQCSNNNKNPPSNKKRKWFSFFKKSKRLKQRAASENIEDNVEKFEEKGSVEAASLTMPSRIVKVHESTRSVDDFGKETEKEHVSTFRVVDAASSALTIKKEDMTTCTSNIEIEEKTISYNFERGNFNNQPISHSQPIKFDMQEIRNILRVLQESELNLKRVLAKYIQDRTKEQELYKAISIHGKNFLQAERKAYMIATKMWEQKSLESTQLEKDQQEKIEALIKETRRLEDEIEKLRSKQETISFTKIPRFIKQESLPNMQLKKNNDTLRSKISSMAHQIECLETVISSLKSTNKNLEVQIVAHKDEIDHFKGLLQKTNMEHELEETSLLKQLSSNEAVIKDCVASGESLMDDMESLKRQLKDYPVSINLKKFQSRGSSLPDLINLTRLWVNDISRELLNTKSKLDLSEKDINFNSTELARLKIENQEISTELLEAKNNAEELSTQIFDYKDQVQKIPILESELAYFKKEVEIKSSQLNEERNYALISSENINELSKTITNREMAISGLQATLQEYKNECSLLRSQMENTDKMLNQSYLTTLMKQLAESQAVLMQYQSFFSEYSAAKSLFEQQSKQFTVERAQLVQNQQSFFDHLQEKHQQAEKLNIENWQLKERVLEQHSEMLKKSREMFKEMSENNVMKHVYSQLNDELLRKKDIEASAINMNFEANRLAVAAEHNSYVSKQLQDVIQCKDETISNLHNTIDKMNQQRQESADEKMALCQRFTELNCSFKQLKDELDNEKQRVKHLTETKEEIEKITEYKLQEMQQMLTVERKSLKELMNDHQNVKMQKSNLSMRNEQYKTQIENLQASENKLQLLYQQTEAKYHKLDEKCRTLQQNLQDTQRTSDCREIKHKTTIAELENKIMNYDDTIKKLNQEKEKLQSSVNYLQCTSNKLRNELDELRKLEQGCREEKMKLQENVCGLEKVVERKSMLAEQTKMECKELRDKFHECDENYRMKMQEYEAQIEEMKKRECTISYNIEKQKQTNLELVDSMEQLVNDSKLRQQMLDETKLKNENLERELYQSNLISQQMTEKAMQSDKNEELERDLITCKEKLNDLMEKYNDCLKMLTESKKAEASYENQLVEITKKREQELDACANLLEEMIISYKQYRKDLSTEFNRLASKLEDFKIQKQCKCERIKSLQEKFQNTSGKLKETINMLVEEKIQKKCLEENCMKLGEKLRCMKTEMKKYQDNIKKIGAKISNMSITSDKIVEVKNNLKKELKYSINSQVEHKKYSEDLEKQLHSAKERLKEFTTSKNLRQCYKDNNIEEQILQSTIQSLEKSEARINLLKHQLQETHEKMLDLRSECALLVNKIQELEFEKSEMVLSLKESETKLILEQKLTTGLKQNNERLLSVVWQTKYGDISSLSVMDFLSQTITENRHIKPYLELLNLERQNYDQVQELLTKELDEYIKLGVILNRNLIVEKLFRVTVKIFDDLFDLHKFNVPNLKNYFTCSDCKFYLIEIHVSNLFQSKIVNDNFWFVNVSVKNENRTINRVARLKNLIPTEPFKIIIPFDDPAHFSQIETTFFATNETFWPNIKISTTNIDVSYHFSPFKNIKPVKNNPVYEISRLYTDRVKLRPVKAFFEYSFTCNNDVRSFLEILLKNCYHRLDINQLQQLTASTELIDVNLTIDNSKSSIIFDRNSKTLKIVSNVEELCSIKKYIVGNLGGSKYSIDRAVLSSLQNLRKQLSVEKSRNYVDISRMEIIYREYKELIAKLPV